MQDALDTLGGIIWGPFLLIPLLLGTGLYLTIRQLTEAPATSTLHGTAELERLGGGGPQRP